MVGIYDVAKAEQSDELRRFLSVRSTNVLRDGGIRTIAELLKLNPTQKQLCRYKNMGIRSANEVLDFISEVEEYNPTLYHRFIDLKCSHCLGTGREPKFFDDMPPSEL